MKKVIKLISILLAILLLPMSYVYGANTPIVQDGDIDGGARILRIHCPDGNRTTVRLYIQDYKQYKDGETCIYRDDGSDICRANWDHDEAAQLACSQ